jgi:hypothetical protein
LTLAPVDVAPVDGAMSIRKVKGPIAVPVVLEGTWGRDGTSFYVVVTTSWSREPVGRICSAILMSCQVEVS